MFSNVYDLKDVGRLINQGYISKRMHPEFPICIFNYTNKTQYSGEWNEATISCRGLITTNLGDVVSRPFRKFFNLHQMESIPFDEDYEVYEKLDGSLGISYFWQGRHWIATRGSFDSPQAQEANKMLTDEYAFVPMSPEVTFLFEIIYPENRIVVRYNQRKLVILAKVIIRSGEELHPPSHPGFPAPVVYDISITDPWPVIPNHEGFVIRFSSGVRVKVKQEEYLRLHRIVSDLSKIRVWEYLSEGKDIVELAQGLPDEFHKEILAMASDIMAEYYRIERDAQDIFRMTSEWAPEMTRKEYSRFFLTYPRISGILFKMLDGKGYDELIWKLIKPKVE